MSFNYQKDEQGIVTITMDMPNRSANVINMEFLESLQATVEKLLVDDFKGVIITSAKKTFLAGGDVEMLYRFEDPKAAFSLAEIAKVWTRTLETFGKPVVAAINGTCLGGGLEIALCCHYRICVDKPKIKLGFPEVTLGLLPGGGGVTRLVRILGLEKAFPFLIEGKKINPQKALEKGIIHEVSKPEDLIQRAKKWILDNPESSQPWDQKGYKIPGGTSQKLAFAPAMLLAKTRGNYPAPEAIMSAAVEGALVDFDTASRIESRYFAQVVTCKEAKNMMKAFWFQMNQISGGENRPKEIPPTKVKKVGVLGSGMMGHGIAAVSAKAGMEVVMTDADEKTVEAGLANIKGILKEHNIIATTDYSELKGCDLIIEAVFEDRELKGKVTEMAEKVMEKTGVFASNTSTLPITSLAEKSSRPENFIGLHFFSPVHKMKLVEIIRGKKTSASTLAKAFDYVLKIGKVPIVVNDSRGFYTSRVFGTYPEEGMALLEEGQNPRAIESAGKQAGMPVGPLALMDEVSLSLLKKVRLQTQKDLGKELPKAPGDSVFELMMSMNRPGKASGAGFYEYPDKEKKYLWPELQKHFPEKNRLSQTEMMERMMFVQALETVRCLEENVVTSIADANIGSVFGWGFAPFKGGTLQFINDYGLRPFVKRAYELEKKYGARFKPPKGLVVMAEKDQRF